MVAEVFEIFLNGSLEELLHLDGGLHALLQQLPRVVSQMAVCLLDDSRQLSEIQLFVVVNVTVNVARNRHERDRVHAKSLAQQVDGKVILVLFAFLSSFDLLLHLRVGVRHSMSKPDLIVLVRLELVLEAEGEIGLDAFACSILLVQKLVTNVFGLSRLLVPWNVVLGICDFDPTSEPACAVLVVPAFGPYARHHAVLVETRGLGQVQNIEFDLVDLLLRRQGDVLVHHFEEIPLCMALGVPIVLQPQVVFDVVDLGGLPQVAVLEPTVEDQNVLDLRHVQLRLDVGVVSVGAKFGQVFVKELVVVGFEVVLAGFLGEMGVVHLT